MKPGCSAGSVAGGHTVRVSGMGVAGLCARFAPTIKWHRVSSTSASTFCEIIKWASLKKNIWPIIFIKIE